MTLSRKARVLVALQFGIPGVLYAARLLTGSEHVYGWGWQMFS